MTAPLGAIAKANGSGARSRPNFLTISRSAESVTRTIAALARSETLASAPSKTFFMAVVCSSSVFQKKPNRYLLSLAASSINAIADFRFSAAGGFWSFDAVSTLLTARVCAA